MSLIQAYSSLNTAFVDLMFKYNGLSVAAEYANKQINGDRLVDTEGNFVSNYYTGSGTVVQAGYLLPSLPRICRALHHHRPGDRRLAGICRTCTHWGFPSTSLDTT